MSDTDNKIQTLSNGLIIEDLLEGEGKEVVKGSTILAHYHGTFLDGTVFDSSIERNEPFSATIGVGQLIKGWDIGIIGMLETGKRKLTVPASLAYGDNDIPGIPAGSTLVFVIDLLKIQ